MNTIEIDKIIIGPRFRKDMGDVESLARNMAEYGQVTPVLLSSDFHLIDGGRRIAAAKLNGQTEIGYVVVPLVNIMVGEFASNTDRKDWTSSEMVAIQRALEARIAVPRGRPAIDRSSDSTPALRPGNDRREVEPTDTFATVNGVLVHRSYTPQDVPQEFLDQDLYPQDETDQEFKLYPPSCWRPEEVAPDHWECPGHPDVDLSCELDHNWEPGLDWCSTCRRFATQIEADHFQMEIPSWKAPADSDKPKKKGKAKGTGRDKLRPCPGKWSKPAFPKAGPVKTEESFLKTGCQHKKRIHGQFRGRDADGNMVFFPDECVKCHAPLPTIDREGVVVLSDAFTPTRPRLIDALNSPAGQKWGEYVGSPREEDLEKICLLAQAYGEPLVLQVIETHPSGLRMDGVALLERLLKERVGGRPVVDPSPAALAPRADQTRDKVARYLGISGRTLDKAKAIVEAAEENPEKWGHLVEEADRTGKVDGIYKRLKTERRREEIMQKRGDDDLPGFFMPGSDHAIQRGDCIEVMDQLEAGSVDLIWADPPYNISGFGGYSMVGDESQSFDCGDWDNRPEAEYWAWIKQVLISWHRVLAPHGSFYMCVDRVESSRAWHLAREVGFHPRNKFTWAKTNPVGNRRDNYDSGTEEIIFCTKGTGHVFNRPPDAQHLNWWMGPSVSGALRELYPHPTPKPVELVRLHILTSTHPGALVVDPFGGSGPTIEACVQTGRKCLAIDNDEGHCLTMGLRLGKALHRWTQVDEPITGWPERSEASQLILQGVEN